MNQKIKIERLDFLSVPWSVTCPRCPAPSLGLYSSWDDARYRAAVHAEWHKSFAA